MGAEWPVCVPASLVKGLEFETVVVAEPARIVRAGPRGLHRLYMVLTRAVSATHIVHAEPFPEPLAGSEAVAAASRAGEREGHDGSGCDERVARTDGRDARRWHSDHRSGCQKSYEESDDGNVFENAVPPNISAEWIR